MVLFIKNINCGIFCLIKKKKKEEEEKIKIFILINW